MNNSPLSDRHLQLNAKMADFGGWLMPIEYAQSGVIAEYTSVRERVGLFDVSHLGKISIKGEGALAFLNQMVTNDLTRIEAGQAQYNLLCNENGGVVDDLIVYKYSDSNLFLIPNAANTTAVFQMLKESAPSTLTLVNQHKDYAVLALQGPDSVKALGLLGIESDLDYMAFKSAKIESYNVILCRTGYTGELGFEIIPTWSDAEKVWDKLVQIVDQLNGAICGLGARDILRTEMGYPLHGHELSLEISPVTAGSSWAVGWQKDTFAGSAQLREEKGKGSVRILRGLLADEKGIPRAGMQVKNSLGNVIGEVTSGTFSPTLKNGIALALIDSAIGIGEQVLVDIRGRNLAMSITKLPFVPSHVR